MCTWVVIPFYYVISNIYIVHKAGWIQTNRSPSQSVTAMSFFCVSRLFSYPDFTFVSLARDYRVSETRELNKLQRHSIKAQKRRIFYFIFSWGCELGCFSLFEIFEKYSHNTYFIIFIYFSFGFSLWVCVVHRAVLGFAKPDSYDGKLYCTLNFFWNIWFLFQLLGIWTWHWDHIALIHNHKGSILAKSHGHDSMVLLLDAT